MGFSDDPPKPDDQLGTGLDDLDSLLEGVSFDEPYEEPAPANPLTDLLGRFRKKEEPPAAPPAAKSAEAVGGDVAAPAAPAAKKSQKHAAKKRKKRGLSLFQIIVLLVMGIAVLGVTVAIGFIIVRSMTALNTPAGDGVPEVVVLRTPSDDWPTKDGDSQVEPNPYTTPVPTPTPMPFVSPTQYDHDIRNNPNDVSLRILRGNEYLGLSAYEAAVLDFEHAIAQEKDNAEAYAGLGKAYFMLHRWGEAETAYNTSVAFNEDVSEVHFSLGMLHYYQEKYVEAAREFDWAAEIDPTFVEAECWLAIASARVGDAVEAQGAVDRAAGLTDDLPLFFIARSWARRVHTPPDLDNALSDLLHAQDLEPYDFEVLNSLARFYMEFRPERLAEAEQLALYAVDWARQSDVNRARGLHTLGNIYMIQGRKMDARAVLNEAADLVMSDGRIPVPGLAADLEETFAP